MGFARLSRRILTTADRLATCQDQPRLTGPGTRRRWATGLSDLTGASLRRRPTGAAGRGAGYSDSPTPGRLLFRPSMCPCENVRMDGLACPCGLGDGYESCCGRLHAGAAAPTAESLMRSRYSAFAVRDAGYLLRTWHPSARPRNLSFDPALQWTRLAVLERATADSSTPPARCSSVRRTSSTASVASSRRRASSSGKTDTGPTSVPLTKGRLPHRAITLKSAMSDHLENRTGSPDLCACRSDCSRPRRCADVPVLALSATNHHFGVTVPAIAGRTSPGRAS